VSGEPPDRTAARRERQKGRRRVVAAMVGATVVVLVAAAVAVAVTGDDDPSKDRAVAASTTRPPITTTTAQAPDVAPPPATTATTAPPDPLTRRYAVSTYTVDFVDTTRTESPNGSFQGASNRTLTTKFWYPALVDGGDPDRAHGPYPLLLFIHGYDQTADFYAPLLERWASAGYVVAGPTYPFLSGIPGGPSHVDFDKLFGDSSFVITRTLASGPDTPIGGLVDGTRIAAAGHSDGEMVSFRLGFGVCCREWRIRSVITMAGDLSRAGIDPIRDSGLPILAVTETNDEYDPYQPSIDWARANLTPPRWMLSLLGASHVPPYNQPGNPHFELVATTTVDFLDGTLKDRPDRLDQLSADVAAHPELATLER
jgi:hypothetical protein